MSIQTNDTYQMKNLLSAIHQADSILLFSHISPDGDTIGSALALKMMLTRLRKRVVLVLDGEVPSNLFFLPDLYDFRRPEDQAEMMKSEMTNVLAIAVDVSCIARMGTGEKLFLSAPVTAQIDHHETNPAYAQINVIDSAAPATAILIDRVGRELGLSVEQEEAICLYTGLSTDTGNFVYESTNAEAFCMMGRLMDAGLPLAKYSRILFRRKERELITLLGIALPTMTYLCNGEIAGMQLSQSAVKAAGIVNENTEGIVDYAIDASGVKMAYFAHETAEGRIRFNLRALKPNRVDQVAALFGGGGHPLASGCTVEGPLDEAVKRLQEALVCAREGKLGL